MFKVVKVVMLPSKEKAGLVINPSTGKIQYIDFDHDAKYYTDAGFTCNHIYIISDDKIKEGDWCVIDLGENTRVVKVKSLNGTHPIFNIDIYDGYAQLSNLKKIIATTDILYIQDYFWNGFDAGVKRLPQLSQSFIQKYLDEYNKGNLITDIMVEYEKVVANEIDGLQFMDYNPKLKVSKDNIITIRIIKNSYSTDEVIELCKSAFITGSRVDDITFDEWVKQNF